MFFYLRSKDVFQKKIDGSLCLLKKKANFVYKLNETSAFLWEILEKRTSSEDLSKALRKEYDIPLVQADNDVKAFLTYYLKEKLIKKISD